MTKRRLNIFLSSLLVVTLGFMFSGNVAHAGEMTRYACDVPKYMDCRTSIGLEVQDNSAMAVNKVNSIEESRSLVSWVEHSNGTNESHKATYNTTGRKYMTYTNGVPTHSQLRLKISTAINTFQTTYTTGNFSPDYF